MTTEAKTLNEAVVERLAAGIAEDVMEAARFEITRSRSWKVLNQIDPVIAQDVEQMADWELFDRFCQELFEDVLAEITRHPGGIASVIAQVAAEREGAK